MTPRKPEGVEKKSAYIIGTGLADLAAAVLLIRDGHMAGEGIYLFEELLLAGDSLYGIEKSHLGFVTRDSPEMENHFECMWDMYRY